MRKFHALTLVLGAGLLGFLLWRIGLAELLHELALLGWGFAPFLLLEVVAEGIHTLGWRRCLSEPYRSLGWFSLFRIRMAGYAINYLTPTAALGGEVTKAALLGSRYPGPAAISGTLVGKVCNAMGHLLFIALGSIAIIWSVKLPPALWLTMLFGSLLITAGVVTFQFLQRHGKLGALVRWLAARDIGGRLVRAAERRMTEIDQALKQFYREHPSDLLTAVWWHVLANTVGIFQTWVFFHFIGHSASLAVATASWILGVWFDLLAFAIPLNLGTLEGGRIIALKALGYTELLGLTYGLTLRFAQLFCVVFGLVSYALLASESPAAFAVNPTASGERNPEQVKAVDD